MANDNYVRRKQYSGLKEVNGQVVLQTDEVDPKELVRSEPEEAEARKNGGGDESKRRRRSVTGEE